MCFSWCENDLFDRWVVKAPLFRLFSENHSVLFEWPMAVLGSSVGRPDRSITVTVTAVRSGPRDVNTFELTDSDRALSGSGHAGDTQGGTRGRTNFLP